MQKNHWILIAEKHIINSIILVCHVMSEDIGSTHTKTL